jgi:hypothetical protein
MARGGFNDNRGTVGAWLAQDHVMGRGWCLRGGPWSIYLQPARKTVTYEVRATFTLDADSKQEALQMVSACIECWDEQSGITNLQGVGSAQGYVTIEEA